MNGQRGIPAPDTSIVLYQMEDGASRIQVRLHDGTVWLNQRLMAELYQVAVPTINEHISTIYGDHELYPEATIRKFLIVQTEGGRQVERLLDFYNLDMILAVGYRVRSPRGMHMEIYNIGIMDFDELQEVGKDNLLRTSNLCLL